MQFTHKNVILEDLNTVIKDDQRFYQTPSGNLYPSVTTVTSLYNKQEILAWRQRVGAAEANRISVKAANRGTRMHKMCEDYLNNELNEAQKNVMPNVKAMFNSIKPIIDEYVNNIHGVELPLFSDHLRVGGKCDCIAEFDGKLSIIDFKTASRQKTEDMIENYFMQCSAYAVMYEERTGVTVNRLAVVIAVESDYPQIFVKKRDDYIEKFISLRDKYKRIHDV